MEILTSLYVLNIVAKILTGGIRKCFKQFSLVKEVFIPLKLSNFGERFGFVRFAEVNNLSKLILSLGDVRMGSFKLIVNIAKFARNSIWEKFHARKGNIFQDGRFPRMVVKCGSFNGVSFKDVVAGRTDVGVGSKLLKFHKLKTSSTSFSGSYKWLDLDEYDGKFDAFLNCFVGVLKPHILISSF
ncbi:hypothetical protein RYX36_022044 [Vicia faba]